MFFIVFVILETDIIIDDILPKGLFLPVNRNKQTFFKFFVSAFFHAKKTGTGSACARPIFAWNLPTPLRGPLGRA